MKLSIVVPCYNEEEVLPETISRLTKLLKNLVAEGKIEKRSDIVFVDDGSQDSTWEIIQKEVDKNGYIKGIKLSRNQGHQSALLAGLFHAKGDAVISIDADLQDDLGAIEKMIAAFKEGADVVYGVRKKRKKDTLFKRLTAESYYRLLRLMGVEIIFNHADYRLLSQRALSALKGFKESNLFLRGIIPKLGFPSAIVYYDRAERFAGDSKYPLKKMIALAWEGITSFSAVPLRLITTFGFFIFLVSFAITLWAIWTRIFTDTAVPGWTSTVVPIYLLGGMQMLSIGILGEYLSKVYWETKRRPHYIIESIVEHDKD
jgi:glycosyltransferase involved in cell wall biosynthesis